LVVKPIDSQGRRKALKGEAQKCRKLKEAFRDERG
jgi:hypothetical protein